MSNRIFSESPPLSLLDVQSRTSHHPVALWEQTLAQTDVARAAGSLQPIRTQVDTIRQQGIDFTVHTLAPKDPKAAALVVQHQTQAAGQPADPFLPPFEPGLFVADISLTHVCLLNKFPVLHHHLVMVTRQDEPQTDLLTLADFQALWACLAQVDGLAFYNGGAVAGASQAHKHLQLVPFRGNDRVIPLEGRILGAGLPFRHALVRLDPRLSRHPGVAARSSLIHYHRLMRQIGLARQRANPAQPGPYNLLLTRRWMLLVPRRRESWAGIGVNGLGFAGSLLVRNAEQMATLRRRTPLLFLGDVVS